MYFIILIYNYIIWLHKMCFLKEMNKEQRTFHGKKKIIIALFV